eukprot:CAMPEP_0113936234 /NCGR_PEP_ID=MMETSP1339-20121228/3189_1 /TAXON_ID=94617 /ORGANISM="Fibrocapsa japonica" /LENGTH=286 /DNA_ID=CAMNT_0000938633 /DNA_START=108 /DNA_END=968 /DNA_ORIENTATION=+ /assembly_acc=CAM_ASM_000762
MVVIHIKRSDTDQFLFETTCTETNDNLIAKLVAIQNTRVKIRALAGAVRALGKYGPMKPPDQQGLDEVEDKFGEKPIPDRGEFYEADPTGIRTGEGVGPQLVETLERVCADAEQAISANQVQLRIAATQENLDDKVANIRGAVTMAYPMGLPDYDVVRQLLEEGAQALEGTQPGQEVLDPETAQLWGAGKEFRRGQCVSDRLGMNEKTKMVAKLQQSGAGAPAREPAVSEDERKAMMAFYFKRQEEIKKLAEANDDDYLASAWADPKSLQRGLRGVGSIKAPGVKP